MYDLKQRINGIIESLKNKKDIAINFAMKTGFWLLFILFIGVSIAYVNNFYERNKLTAKQRELIQANLSLTSQAQYLIDLDNFNKEIFKRENVIKNLENEIVLLKQNKVDTINKLNQKYGILFND